MTVPNHIKWLQNTGTTINLKNGGAAEVWELKHLPDNNILSEWAKYFRNHYCLDNEIDSLRNGTGFSRAEYLYQLVFPDGKEKPGPSIRSGDFAEILMADFIEYLLGYWVPRFRYDEKAVRNESTKGADVLGFKLAGTTPSPKDELLICECKASLTAEKSSKSRLQDAINSSADDEVRKAYNLNAFKRRLIRSGDPRSSIVERFQDAPNNPYVEKYVASAVLNKTHYDTTVLTETDLSAHPKKHNLKLYIMTGDNMMSLVHSLYERAANEA